MGKKTAERLILELKDKIGSFEHGDAAQAAAAYANADESATSDARTEAIRALTALGYTKAEAFGAVSKVTEEGLSCEDYIKKALKNLF